MSTENKNLDTKEQASFPLEEGEKLSRRDWLERAMWLSLGIPSVMSAMWVLRYVYPQKKETKKEVYLCKLSDIPLGESRLFKGLEGQEFVVARIDGGITALSTRCTHLGCKVHWLEKEQKFFCPCHEGYFDKEGKVLAGPPPRPLDKVPVIEKDGHLYVTFKEV